MWIEDLAAIVAISLFCAMIILWAVLLSYPELYIP